LQLLLLDLAQNNALPDVDIVVSTTGETTQDILLMPFSCWGCHALQRDTSSKSDKQTRYQIAPAKNFARQLRLMTSANLYDFIAKSPCQGTKHLEAWHASGGYNI